MCLGRVTWWIKASPAESEGSLLKGTRVGLGTQLRYKAPSDLQVKYVRMQWLTSNESGFPLDNGSKLALGQQNSKILAVNKILYQYY